MNNSAVKPKDGEEEAYLVVPEEHRKTVIGPETIWAKIGDDGGLEIIRWDIINMYAAQYDFAKEKSQTQVMCKLLVLVREQARKEAASE